jgi:acyl-CoA thioesterase I
MFGMMVEQAGISGRRISVQSVLRIARVILNTLLIFASLVVFPAAIPWLVAFWLSWHTFLVFRNRPGWLPLAVCIAVLAVKLVDWSPSLFVMAILMGVVCLLRRFGFTEFSSRRSKWYALLGLTAMWLGWAFMTSEWYSTNPGTQKYVLQPERPIVCIGDSLSAFGYPTDLQQLLSVPVVNLACDGITTQGGIDRLPLIQKANPQVVVIELGGHDYLQECSRATTKRNLEKIIDACRSFGAEVVLLEIPRGFIVDPYTGLEREIARQKGVVLISDTPIRKLVLWSPYAPPGIWLTKKWHFSDDGLHPNAQGNKMLANYVAETLARMYGGAIWARSVQDSPSHEK